PLVGGKNASIGEMLKELSPLGINIPDGFATTAEAFRIFIRNNRLQEKLGSELQKLNTVGLDNLSVIGANCRAIVSAGEFPDDMKKDILNAYEKLRDGKQISVAVRSSATAEDLPTASFAGQHDSFLNVVGFENLLLAIHKCYVSLFND